MKFKYKIVKVCKLEINVIVIFIMLDRDRQFRGRNRGGYNYNRYNNAGATEQRLIGELLEDYDTDARGVLDPNTTVTVELQLLLLRIQSLVSVVSVDHELINMKTNMFTKTSILPMNPNYFVHINA
jgi:hypothetical protein